MSERCRGVAGEPGQGTQLSPRLQLRKLGSTVCPAGLSTLDAMQCNSDPHLFLLVGTLGRFAAPVTTSGCPRQGGDDVYYHYQNSELIL